MNSNNPDWIKQYIELMLADNPEDAIPIKLEHFPKRFYRYCALTDCNFLNLEKEQLWLSKIETLNDPFECGMMFDPLASIRLFFRSDLFRDEFKRNTGIRITDAEVTAIVSSDNPYNAYLQFCAAKSIIINQSYEAHNAKIMQRWREILEEVKEKIRVCCFTTRNDSILMWSHYAVFGGKQKTYFAKSYRKNVRVRRRQDSRQSVVFWHKCLCHTLSFRFLPYK